MEGLREALVEHGVSYGTFVAGSGELKTIDLISDSYEKPILAGPFTVDKVSGNVKLQKEGHTINLHLTLVKKGMKSTPMSGQLKRGIVNGQLQLTIQLSDLNRIIQ